MFELVISITFTFVVTRMNAKFLKNYFDEIFCFPVKLNDLDLIKFKKPPEGELNGIIEGNIKFALRQN